MKKILFITNMIPFPGNSGGTIKTRRLLDGLINKGYGIYLCFLDVKENSNYEYWYKQYKDKLLGFHRVYNGNNVRSFQNYICSVIHNQPLNVFRNNSNELGKIIKNILETENIDVIIADHLESVQFVPKVYRNHAIFHEHNAEFKIWERYAAQQRNIAKKMVAFLESRRIKRYEIRSCEEFRVVKAAPMDIEFLSEGRNTEKFQFTYHMGNEELLEYPDIEFPEKLNILFIGTLTWEANILGVRWFVKKVLPYLDEACIEYTVNIIGKSEKDVFTDLMVNHNVYFRGFVDDLEEYMKKAAVFICPIFFGSGMKIKIVEAMYRGIPFVTTTVGAESIVINDIEKKYEFPYAGVVTNDEKEFAEAILSLYENKEKWLSVSRTARCIARREYRWENEIARFCNSIEHF